MAEDKWIELEYQALQDQMSKLLDISQTAIRFCIPIAGAVYALPVVAQQPHQVYLWALCSALSGLLITAMVHTFSACVTGSRRIGAYIKEAIEPRTNNGMKWEAMLFEWEKREAQTSVSSLLAVSAGTLLANVAAAAGAGAVFLRGWESMIPAAIASFFVLLGLPTAFRTSRAANTREQCVRDVRQFLASSQDHGVNVLIASDRASETVATVDGAVAIAQASEGKLPITK